MTQLKEQTETVTPVIPSLGLETSKDHPSREAMTLDQPF
jgi:hypothetical protein